jgi:hypothetical protein
MQGKFRMIKAFAYLTILFSLTIAILFFVINDKYPSIKLDPLLLISLTIFIFYAVFNFWLLKEKYPDKELSPVNEMVHYFFIVACFLAILYSYALIIVFLSVIIEKISLYNMDLKVLFFSLSITFFLLSVVIVLLVIFCFKLFSSINKNYHKTITDQVKSIGKGS